MRPRLYCVVDVESTRPVPGASPQVFDFAAVVTDRHGNLYDQIAVLIPDVGVPFWDESGGFFDLSNLDARLEAYAVAFESGDRVLAAVEYINRWVVGVVNRLDPVLVAYFLAGDIRKCADTGIDLTIFGDAWDLWHACVNEFVNRRFVRWAVQQGHVSAAGNLVTKAEVMAAYLLGITDEQPHMALEDLLDVEVPLLQRLLERKHGVDRTPYHWRRVALSNWE